MGSYCNCFLIRGSSLVRLLTKLGSRSVHYIVDSSIVFCSLNFGIFDGMSHGNSSCAFSSAKTLSLNHDYRLLLSLVLSSLMH